MKKICFLAISILSATLALGQVRTWVSPTGLDTNLCTRDQPCRNFTAAITAVAAGGEVVALESGGYGPVTITKSVTVLAPNGVHAAIAPTAGHAIAVNAGDTAHVVLRNLYLNSQGAGTGIESNMDGTITIAALYVEKCVVSGFSGFGISFAPMNAGARLYVSDTVIRRSGFGIFVVGLETTFPRATIDSVRIDQNDVGVLVGGGAEATIRESSVSGGSDLGYWAGNDSKLLVLDSMATSNNSSGFYARPNGVMTMTRCLATFNAYGVRAEQSGSTIYVSDSTITSNATGVTGDSGGVVTTRGNNTLRTNTTNGAFSQLFNPD